MTTNFTRIIFSMLLVIYSFIAAAQKKEPFDPHNLPILVDTRVITYVEIIPVPGANGMEVLTRGLNWFHTFYKNPTDVIRSVDSVSGKIEGKARFKIYNPPDKKGVKTDAGNVEYSIKLNCKEAKFRYFITDMNWKHTSYYPVERWQDTTAQTYQKVYDFYLQQADSTVHTVIENLKSYMTKPTGNKKDDW